MKILILSSKVPFPLKDGGAIATMSLAESLNEEGHEISMLCLNTNKHFFEVKNIAQSFTQKIRFQAVNHNTDIKPLRLLINFLFSKQPYNAQRFYSTEYEKSLKQFLELEKPDIVQLEGPYMGYYIPTIKKYSDSKISLRAHNVENEIWKRKCQKTRNPLIRIYLKNLSNRIENLEKKVLKNSDYLIAISEKDRLNLLKLSDIQSITVSTGLNPDNYPNPDQPKFPTIFFIGALDWMPNQEGIVWFLDKVFLNIRKKVPDLEFHIAGRNAPQWLSEKLLSFKESGLVFHGEVESAYEFMNKYSIFISPLFTGSGIRIKILEGMMMKRVLIATTVAIEGIPATHSKDLFISDDAQEWGDIIIDLCADQEKFNKIAEASRQFITENFNTFASGKKLSDFYRTNRL